MGMDAPNDVRHSWHLHSAALVSLLTRPDSEELKLGGIACGTLGVWGVRSVTVRAGAPPEKRRVPDKTL